MKNWTKKKINMAWETLRVKPQMTKKEKAWRSVLIGIIIAALAFGGFLGLYIIYLLFTLPSPAKLGEMNLTESTLIMDREGNLLYAIHGEENRESLDDLNDISPWLVDATVAIEDDKFYKHIGIDLPALVKALLSEVGIGTPRGGSTITQQFVKNTFLSPEQTYARKLQEIILSLGVELRFNKDEIMLMYLNAIPYGSNSYGIELAADRYFGKDAKDLDLAESALLASIPKAPTRYSPYGNYRYSTIHFELTEENLGKRKIKGESDLEYDEWTRGLIGKEYTLPNGESFYLKGRSDLVLDRMEELGFIDSRDKAEALSEIQEIAFTPYQETIKAPHFVLWVKQQLEEKYGAPVVEQGGLKVYTTLDPTMQDAAEEAVAERKEFNADNYNATDAALVSVQPETGQILAMVGSADYFDDEIDGQVNIITSNRQPGSSFKPFVYALAFLNQYTPADVLYDVRTDFGSNYIPENYDGSFGGPMSIRKALAQSRNIPAVKAYFLAGRQEALVPFVKELGLESIKEEADYGSSLALGTPEVTPLEMAEAYSVFANTGTHVDLTPILRIENADGEILEQWEEEKLEKKEVLDPEVAYLINDILSDPSVSLGPNNRIDSIDNAAKTGTSNKETDRGTILPNNGWLAAYTPELVTITWAGNANGDAMTGNATGYSTASPIWKNYMTSILDELEPTDWPRPEGIKNIAVSLASGKLPSENTPSDMIATEVFASFAVPTEVDDSYKTLRIETVTDRLATEYSPTDSVEEKSFRIHRSIVADLYPSWQAAIDKWAKANGDEQPPTESAADIHNQHTAQNIPSLEINTSNNRLDPDEKIHHIEVSILEEGNGMDKVEYSINNVVTFTAQSAPYTGLVRLPTTIQEGEEVLLTARAIDIYGYSSSASITMRVGKGGGNSSNNPQANEILDVLDTPAILQEEL